MDKLNEFKKILQILRGENGCPWDRKQTHSSLKAPCIEEAAEVICAVNILDKTGDSDNLKEELGDLLMQVVMHACIAEEEGLFTLDDVIDDVRQKIIRRHPHVFGDAVCTTSENVLVKWEEIKAEEKKDKKQYDEKFLSDAFDECDDLINAARVRKGFDQK